jgi:hypothetical protein
MDKVLGYVYNVPPPNYGSLLTLKIAFEKLQSNTATEETVTYQLPVQTDAFLVEAMWGAPLAFSNLALDDLIFLYTAIMLENSVLLVSKNLALLTSTM